MRALPERGGRGKIPARSGFLRAGGTGKAPLMCDVRHISV